MKTFLQHLSMITEAAMTASGAKAEDHISKYLKPEQTKTLQYAMAKDSAGAKAGDMVTVRKVVPGGVNAKGETVYHAHIEHAGGRAVVPLNHLMKPEGVGRAGKGSEDKEDAAVSDLHQQIQDAVTNNGGKPIKVTHMGKTYNITGARKVVSGDFRGRKPKADIILHDEQGKPAIFLSHKAGPKPTDAQNYEGLSSHNDNPHVQRFIQDLQTAHPGGLASGQSYVRTLPTASKRDQLMHRKVMFGSDATLEGSNQYGVHNVHSIEHGKIDLNSGKRGVFTLSSQKSVGNDENFQHKEHPLEFTARYMKDRKDNGVQNARIGIARVGSRPTSKVLEKQGE